MPNLSEYAAKDMLNTYNLKFPGLMEAAKKAVEQANLEASDSETA